MSIRKARAVSDFAVRVVTVSGAGEQPGTYIGVTLLARAYPEVERLAIVR
jgi:hypothetical protein